MPELPIAPEPDAKDWTWVIESACSECGFDASAVDPASVAGLIRQNAADWSKILSGETAVLMARPAPAVWSASEYAAHVRDVYAKFDMRLTRMRAEDGPRFENWDQDATAIEERYDLQEPGQILLALLAKAERLARNFEAVNDDEWERTGFRSDGASFTIATFAQYLIHDPVHHVHDARTGLAGLAR